jgi:HPt (histidine-containing phosphotransfer) domain-containing protein
VTAVPVPYDRVEALKNLEDSEDLLREIAGIFIADYRDDLDAMRIALEIGDATTLFRLAHTLKSSLASFCAQKAFDAASVLVKQARAGELDADQLTVVETLTEEVVAALRAEIA